MKLELDSFEMIEKADMPNGYQAVLSFGDKYQLSIISGEGAYGYRERPYEIGLFKEGNMIAFPGITDEDEPIRGYLTKEEVSLIIKKMYLLTGKTPSQV